MNKAKEWIMWKIRHIFDGDELVGCASILEKKNFMKIDYEESECG